ncbi:uncharacterized protein PG986_010300 [Apiospora aurea]|uniref:Uncharacterized protein n=1 Tax=Apiospora aurea TaxID=335848 RepID=A0ABR1QA36_9PEZI
MAHLLFPAGEGITKGRRKDEYHVLCADIVRAGSDAIDALSLFHHLVVGADQGDDAPGYMAFDAHVGETGCHLRAGMFLDLFSIYRRHFDNNDAAWRVLRDCLEETQRRLRLVIDEAGQVCAKLTQANMKPTVLGLKPKQDTPERILEILGWQGLKKDSIDQKLGFLSLGMSTATGSSLDMSDCSPLSLVVSGASSVDGFFGSTEPASQAPSTTDSSAASSDASTAASSCGDDSDGAEDDLGGAPSWPIHDVEVVVRLVVFSYILSKYKAFSYYNGSPNGKLEPQLADELTMKLVQPRWGNHCKRPGLRRIENEFREMQIWLSDTSCEWLQSLARGSSIRPSMLRLVDKRSTHLNVFTATLAADDETDIQCHQDSINEVHDATIQTKGIEGPSIWRIRQTSLEGPMGLSDPTTPHMVVMGNSIDGSYKAYTDLVYSSLRDETKPQRTREHRETEEGHHHGGAGHCVANEEHVEVFLRADHDKLALSFFAIHPAYAFPLGKGEEDVDRFIQDKASDWSALHGPQLWRLWQECRADADQVGTGEGYMGTFRWQHAFLESKGRLGALLRRAQMEEDLMPLKAPI